MNVNECKLITKQYEIRGTCSCKNLHISDLADAV